MRLALPNALGVCKEGDASGGAESLPNALGVYREGGAESKEKTAVKLIINDSPHIYNGDGTVAALLAEMGATPEHSAVTVNGDIIFSRDWNTFTLSDGDAVEVLTFVGGG